MKPESPEAINEASSSTFVAKVPDDCELASSTIAKLLSARDNTLFAHSLWVEPKFRRQGNSEKIMNHCIDMAKNNGFKYITFITNKDNTPARGLYDKLGFDTHVSDDSQIFYFRPL